MERHYVFLVNNRVENILVFNNQDDDLAARICSEQGYDNFVWLDDAVTPKKWSTYDGSVFTDPTDEYLISIGVLNEALAE